MYFFIGCAILVLILYLFISEFYFKRHLHIPASKINILSKNRNKSFVFLECISVISYFVFTLLIVILTDISQIKIAALLLGSFVISNIIQTIELWKFQRENKIYYHHFLSSVLVLILVGLTLVGERYFEI